MGSVFIVAFPPYPSGDSGSFQVMARAVDSAATDIERTFVLLVCCANMEDKSRGSHAGRLLADRRVVPQ
jgi:hypothetical protein